MSLLADVAVTTPSSRSLISKGSATIPLHAATLRENDKRSKYASLAREKNLSLIPFVLESYGGWGKGARTVLAKVVSAGVCSSGGGLVSEADALTHARRTVAIALVQGNARLISTALRLARCRAPPPRAEAPSAPPVPAARPLRVVLRDRSAAPVVQLEQQPAVHTQELQQLPRSYLADARLPRH